MVRRGPDRRSHAGRLRGGGGAHRERVQGGLAAADAARPGRHARDVQHGRLLQQLQRGQALVSAQHERGGGARGGVPARGAFGRVPDQPHPARRREVGRGLRVAAGGQSAHHRRLSADAGLDRAAQGLHRLRGGADAGQRAQPPERGSGAPPDRRGHELPRLHAEPGPHDDGDPGRAAAPRGDRRRSDGGAGADRVGGGDAGAGTARLHGERPRGGRARATGRRG